MKKKIFIAVLLLFVIAVPVAMYFGANYFFQKQLEYVVNGLGIADEISWSKSGINIFKRSAYVENIRYGNISIDKLTFTNFSYKTRLSIKLDNFRLPVTENVFGRFYQPVYSMGYDEFVLNSTIHFVLGNKRLEITANNADISDIGSTSVFMAFDNVLSERILNAIVSVVNEKKQLAEGRVTFNNASGILERSISVLAAASGSSYENTRARILNALDRKIKNSKDSTMLQLQRFLEAPAALSIQLSDAPVQWERLIPDTVMLNNSKGWRALGTWLENAPLSFTNL